LYLKCCQEVADHSRQASYDAPTESELLELAAEEDGTVLGEQKVEQKRQKEEKWATFTDSNKKGAGNTMNRG
jgi:immunoglobulin-binding protein 1